MQIARSIPGIVNVVSQGAGSGTYTPHGRMRSALVIVTGGGGSGANNASGSNGGGGGGATVFAWLTRAEAAGGIAYTVGAAGAASTFSHPSGTITAGAGTTSASLSGGAGGTATQGGGFLACRGAPGHTGMTNGTNYEGGNGGASWWGGPGGNGPVSTTSAGGATAVTPGAGGSGSIDAGGAGAGAAGRLVILEFGG